MNPSDRLRHLAWIITSPEQSEEVPPADIPELLGALETVKARLWSRLNTPALPETQAQESNGSDRLLSAQDAADRLGVKQKWMYSHADTLPFTRRIGERTVRFSEKGLLRWMERQKAER